MSATSETSILSSASSIVSIGTTHILSSSLHARPSHAARWARQPVWSAAQTQSTQIVFHLYVVRPRTQTHARIRTEMLCWNEYVPGRYGTNVQQSIWSVSARLSLGCLRAYRTQPTTAHTGAIFVAIAAQTLVSPREQRTSHSRHGSAQSMPFGCDAQLCVCLCLFLCAFFVYICI